MQSRRILVAAAAVVGIVALTGYASPYWRLHQLQSAVAERDAGKISSLVDFPALRASVKLQLVEQLGAGGLAGAARDNPFAAFGQTMAMAAIDPIVDAVVSPAGVSAMLEAGELRVRRGSGDGQDGPSAPPAQQADTDEQPRYALSYRSWDRVAVAKEGGDGGAFILYRHGLWGWKLGGIELPRRAPSAA
jgi:hypothetical protein